MKDSNVAFDLSSLKYECMGDIPGFSNFKENGQHEVVSFIKNFLGLDSVRVQHTKLTNLRKWLGVSELKTVNSNAKRPNEICLIARLEEKGKIIALYPMVLSGYWVSDLSKSLGLLKRIADAITEQISICYLRDFKGGEWMFGSTFAQNFVSGCVSTKAFKKKKFTNLIEKMEHLSVATFEGSSFTTGVIVTRDKRRFGNKILLNVQQHLDDITKREWFLVDGNESFFLMDSNEFTNSVCVTVEDKTDNFVEDYFKHYYLKEIVQEPDFIVRTVAPNEITVSDSYGREFVKLENVWRFRNKIFFVRFLKDKLGIGEDLCDCIIYYSLKCSRKRISSIIWIPNDDSKIDDITSDLRTNVYKKSLSIKERKHESLMDKILASDGTIVVGKNGDIIYDSVFYKGDLKSETGELLTGTGVSAAKALASNGVAIKISQDGSIKVFGGEDKLIY